MRFACACLLGLGCGFPNVVLDRSTEMDATLPDTSMTDSGLVDTGVPDSGVDSPAVTKGCKGNADCAKTCIGVLPNCGCQAYLADSAPPTCDSSCKATGCVTKNVVCTDAGDCIIQ